MLCAVIQNNQVIQIGDLSEDEIQALNRTSELVVEITNQFPQPQVGWLFNGNAVVPPPVTPENPSNPNMIITRLAFRNRFTQNEKLAIYNIMSLPQGIGLKIYMDDLAASTFIDLSRQDTINGVNFLASIGVLTQDRANAILNTLPTSLEIYRG